MTQEEAKKLMEISDGEERAMRRTYLKSEIKNIEKYMFELRTKAENVEGQIEKLLYFRMIDRQGWEKAKLVVKLRHMDVKNVHNLGVKDLDSITDADINQAREIPIESLLDFYRDGRKKMLKCPFHDDKTPSASIKWNRLHCFTCNKTWGPIDILMERDKMTFIEAVKSLRGR